MKRMIHTALICLAFTGSALCGSPHSVSIEAGGIGGFYSVNYERALVRKGATRLGIRAGISLTSSTIIDFPIALTGLWMPGHNGLEAGACITPELYVADGVTDATMLLSGMLGYRRQLGSGPVFLRCYLNPVVDPSSRKSFAWFGAGAGYGF